MTLMQRWRASSMRWTWSQLMVCLFFFVVGSRLSNRVSNEFVLQPAGAIKRELAASRKKISNRRDKERKAYARMFQP